MSTPDLSVATLFSVKGKIALVTGGGTGVGKSIASALVQNGAKVYIAARKEKQLKETCDELNKKGPGSAHYMVANIVSKAGCDALIEEFKKRETKLHILVNNSGISWGAPFNDVPEAKGWDNVMALNVKSIFYMTAGLADLIIKDSTALDPGRVINISSTASFVTDAESQAVSAPGSGTYSYNVSKAAVNHLTSILAVKLIKDKVTVNAICPGIFPSNMTAFGFKQIGESNMAALQPTGRYGMPQDLAGITLFLTSPASAHVTGAHILLDGGSTITHGHLAPRSKL